MASGEKVGESKTALKKNINLDDNPDSLQAKLIVCWILTDF